jgi:hypothetical protein
MPKLFITARKTSPPAVSFNESTGEVCTAACRADAHRERDRTAAIARDSRI